MLRAVSEGLVGVLLDPGDHSRTATRAVARELLAGCVLRPLLMWCTPYFANKAVCRRVLQRSRVEGLLHAATRCAVPREESNRVRRGGRRGAKPLRLATPNPKP